ncbi:MAG TPA: hypothetical protein VNT02_04080 [Burkholderiales bacterium]|nr:hypothetical protein [Burkholderiales bacterium]
MRGQAYAEYLVVLAVVVAIFSFSGNRSPLSDLADAIRTIYLTHVAATVTPPLPLECASIYSCSQAPSVK